jgi:hypothetical protein
MSSTFAYITKVTCGLCILHLFTSAYLSAYFCVCNSGPFIITPPLDICYAQMVVNIMAQAIINNVSRLFP